jgi:hypothetical protein
MRTAFMFTMTAVVGGIVAARFKDAAFKKDVATRLAWLGIGSAIAGAAMFQWYLSTLPETAALVMQNRLPGWFKPGVLGILAGTVAYFGMTLVQPRTLVSGGAAVMTVAMLVFGLWPEEVARESMRRPWVAGQYVYSNQVIGRDVPGMGVKSEIPLLETHGFMKTQVFMPEHLRTITEANRLEAGRVLALTTCSNCHSLSHTGIRPLKNYFTPENSVGDTATYLQAALSTGNTLYMPQIPLKDDEALALAAYIANLNAPVTDSPKVTTALPAPALSLAAVAEMLPANPAKDSAQ